MRVFSKRNREEDFTPINESEDKSIIYDIFLKLDRLTDIVCMLEKSLIYDKRFSVSKDDWLFKFIVCCGCEISDLEKVELDNEDIKVLLDIISNYTENLIKSVL